MKPKIAAMASALLLAVVTGVSAMDILKVQSFRSGEIILNGKKVSLGELQSRLSQAKAKGDAVWFYREAAEKEPTDQQMQAFKAIIDARIPISLSTKPDFSDTVDMNGQVHPRKN